MTDWLKRLAEPKILLKLACVAVFAMLFCLSIAQDSAFNSVSLDLARMRQAMWNTFHGEPLLMTLMGVEASRLAEHVEISLLLLAPLYRLFPSASWLLALQAALFALGALPVFNLSLRRLQSPRMALALALVYLFYPVAQTAVLFEFHGDTLALPLLLFALEAAERQSWRAYAVFIALALSCKFYVAIPVAAMGLVYLLQGRRRLGLLTGLAAIGWFLVAFLAIRPTFAPPVAASEVKATVGGYFAYYFGQLDEVIATWQARMIIGIIVVLPALLLAARGWIWLIPAATIMVPVLLSTGPGPVFHYKFHHYALAVPFLIMSMIDGAGRLRREQEPAESVPPRKHAPWRRAVSFSLILTIFINALLVDAPLNPQFYSPAPATGFGLSPTGYIREERDQFKEAWLESYVGDKNKVAADHLFAQRLINRRDIILTHPEFSTLEEILPVVNYVAADGLFDYVVGSELDVYAGGVTQEHDTIAVMLQDEAWHLHNARDGMLFFSRDPQGLQQRALRLETEPDAQPLARFGDHIGLLSAQLQALGARRFRLTVEWVALQDLTQSPSLIAVTRPQGIPFSRVVHLPTIGLQPTTTWTAGAVVRESFEFELPGDAPAGEYPLYVGWYRTDSIYSHYTDERTRLGAEYLIGHVLVD